MVLKHINMELLYSHIDIIDKLKKNNIILV